MSTSSISKMGLYNMVNAKLAIKSQLNQMLKQRDFRKKEWLVQQVISLNTQVRRNENGKKTTKIG